MKLWIWYWSKYIFLLFGKSENVIFKHVLTACYNSLKSIKLEQEQKKGSAVPPPPCPNKV